jgi:thiamine-monophosphate kinase
MPNKNYPSGEYELITGLGKILAGAARRGGSYQLTLGDDAAVRLCAAGERLVLTTDIAVENVHFTTDAMSFEEIGFRCMASNVSDCAAMASLPEAALVQLVFPAGDLSIKMKCEAIYRGFAMACRKWKFRLIGGDLSGGPCWTIGITLIGHAPAAGRLLTRRGIKNGDALWLSGFPGRSAAGLAALRTWGRQKLPERYRSLVDAHILPDPPVALGLLLGACPEVHAMMDLSDGISKDGATLCRENKLGLDLSLEHLEAPSGMVALSKELDTPWQKWTLHGGEEYELLFAAGEGFDPTFFHAKARRKMVRLGKFTNMRKGIFMREGKTVREVEQKSWDHVVSEKAERPPL